MIVRILGEGQYELDAGQAASLDELDRRLLAALEAKDETAFHKVLGELIAKVRSEGKPVGTDRFVPSDLTIPHETATLEELRQTLASEEATEA